MRKLMLTVVLLIGLAQSGCAFFGGAALGAAGTGAAYEYNNQMDRKAQIEKGSILY